MGTQAEDGYSPTAMENPPPDTTHWIDPQSGQENYRTVVRAPKDSSANQESSISPQEAEATIPTAPVWNSETHGASIGPSRQSNNPVETETRREDGSESASEATSNFFRKLDHMLLEEKGKALEQVLEKALKSLTKADIRKAAKKRGETVKKAGQRLLRKTKAMAAPLKQTLETVERAEKFLEKFNQVQDVYEAVAFGVKEYRKSQEDSRALRIYEGLFSGSAMLLENMIFDHPLMKLLDVGVSGADALEGGGITEVREEQIKAAREYYERGQLGDWVGSTFMGDWYYKHFLR
jgi:hypothetical protein